MARPAKNGTTPSDDESRSTKSTAEDLFAIEELVGGSRGKAEDGTRTEKSGKKRKEEVETKLGCAAKDAIHEHGSPGSRCDNTDGNTLKIPERTQRPTGHELPCPHF